MFDWLRRQDETGTRQVTTPEQVPGKPQPALEGGADGQPPPERVPATSTAVDGLTAGRAESCDAERQGSNAQTTDAGTGEEESPAFRPVTTPLGGSQPDELARSIGSPATPPPLSGRGAARRPGRRLVKTQEVERVPLTGEQRLWILDTWKRSGLPAGDFAPLVGVSKHTLYSWKKQFAAHGPAGLMEHKRGVREGSRLPELTKRTILLLKEAHPEWGCERISAMLLRGPALPASASAVARVLHEAGYELEEVATRPHADKVRHFERVKPNQLWQTDLFTFVLKRQNGVPKPPFYMTGRVGGQSFSVHAEGERVILRRAGGARQEVELVAPEIAGTDVSAQTRTLGTDAEAASGGAEAANRGGDAADVRAELPRPLCPQGLPEDGVREDAADVAAAPGASPLDKAIDELPQVRRGDAMGSSEESSPRTGGDA